MDLAWKYFQLLSVEKVKLEEKRDELEDGPQKILCINQLERAESQMKSIKEGYKQRDKRAKMLMDATGAKHMTPNALAPLSNEEQQISAELAWNHHDYIMSLVPMGHEEDLAWKYFQLLSVEKVKLEEKRDELEDGPQKILCINHLERAESEMKSIKEGYMQRDKGAKMLMDAFGAKHMTPNALAPFSKEEQQISAELAWNHHDYIMSPVSMGHEDLKEFVAKPECMVGFSDQVPVWVKKGSTKAVFAGHETRTHGKTIKKIRRDLQDELNQQAHETGTQ